ncbi:MAG: hypothetical protein HY848_03285 [Betaproteobacteria bacterium]|nr:hypothetical protein [Betaproteobacteria bacterium]
MSFAADVNATAGLAGKLKAGLGALRAVDRTHISVQTPGSLLGSADVDTAQKTTYPHAARWDYVVGQQTGEYEHLHWIEVHPAEGTRNITEVEAKLAWLAAWLRHTALAAYRKQVVWVASGRSAFNGRHPRIKGLAAKGLSFAGGHLTI